jgi:putative transposase
MGMPKSKFEIINEVVSQKNNKITITELCRIAGVSRSGYYKWLSTYEKRKEQDEKDKADFDLIVKAYYYKGYKKGARSIHMRLLHMNPPVRMNIKKIRRIMKKYNLLCPIRKSNPYRRMQAAIKTNNIADNLLNREFNKHGARQTLLTDITYINYLDKRCYLSTILDSYTKQVLSYCLSKSLDVDFVLETVKSLIEKHGISLDSKTLIHSDQGCHYTSIKFIQIIKDVGLRQSMSRKGNCWDNAPQESFFGHMKDEIDLTKCKNFNEVKDIIDDWINYYNTERYQWDLAKLSPDEYYQYLMTNEYPLPVYSKNIS